LHHLKTRLEQPSLSIATDARVGVERLLRNAFETVRDVGGAWADLLTDRATLANGLAKYAPGAFSVDELNRAHAWCTARCTEVLTEREERLELARAEPVPKRKSKAPPRPASDEDSEIAPTHGIDGRELHEAATMDREDDTLLLRLVQRMHGPLRRGSKNKDPIVYEHVFIDEAQDLSPVELAVVIDTVSKAQSVTLAGDVAQRLLMDNGFTNWNEVLSTLALRHVEVEPLRLSYRSTRQIIDFAQAVLGPLASDEPAPAIRDGANIELFEFAHSGDAVGFLAEALRDLVHSEPRASVAVIARYSEHADIYYHGLKNAELPLLRRIADQDFPFRPGIDVTDVRQVKGLEFDYVVLVEVSDAAYPVDDEARHLLHIGATRAAHQLWVLVTGKPSQLLPESLREHFTP
jgi:DNA helicase-2/ATP-dependent DNA helicase PcrA